MRIVLSHVYAWPEVRRGTERYVHELGAALTSLGHEVVVVTSSNRPGRSLALGVPVHAVKRGGPPGSGSRRTQLAFGVRSIVPVLRHRPDVWHANSLYDGAVAAQVPGLRSVLTMHGPVTPQVLERWAFRVARRADALVSVSVPAQREARALGVDSEAVPPGVDTALFAPGGTRAKRPVVLYVGTLSSPRKKVDLLLRAAAGVPDVEVWLAGPGDPAPLIAAAPESVRARVRHLGVLAGEDLVEAYRRAWSVALLSEREVFGMVVLEGHACGTPALVLDDGWGPAHQVSAATGVATSERDAAQGIRAVLDLSRRKDTSEACRSAAERNDWKRCIAPRLLETYARE